jgi:hypothetical protein
MGALVDPDDGEPEHFADLGEGRLSVVVGEIGRVEPALERLADEDDRPLVRRRGKHSTGKDLAKRKRVVVQRLEREPLLLPIAGLGTILNCSLALGLERDEGKRLGLVLGDDDKLLKCLAKPDGHLCLLDGDRPAVGKVGDREEGLCARGSKREEDVACVDRGNLGRDNLADLHAVEARRVRRNGGVGAGRAGGVGSDGPLGLIGLPDRGANLACGRVDRDDLDTDRLADVGDVGQVLHKCIARLANGDEGTQAAVEVDDGALVEHLGDDAVGDNPG